MTLVSVIVPIYNVEKYLSRCLDSIVSQSFKDIEILCIDDGSTDDSPTILEQYRKFDNRIKTIRIPHSGVADARNYGISLSNGKYIMFVDGDDYISSIMVQELFDSIEKTGADVVLSDYFANNFRKDLSKSNYTCYKQLENTNVITDLTQINKECISNFLHLSVTCWNKIYLSDFIKSNKIKFPSGVIFEDVIFWAEVYLKAVKVFYLPSAFYFYRRKREGSLMSKRDKSVFDVIKIHKMLKTVFIQNNMYEKMKDVLDFIMIRDFIIKILILKQPLKEKLFNVVKELNYEINYKAMEDLNINQENARYIKYYKVFKENDFKKFCEIMKDVNTDEY